VCGLSRSNSLVFVGSKEYTNFTPVPSTPGLAVANFLFYYKYSSPKPQLAVAVLDATPFCFRELIYFERE
jgi:hypothetical protein